ncbi:hypothetical protein EVAR_94361_1 [Eumeta japonica]|uniref:Uncharacterized protein n=1 Tax=Eumeta variegata TaxID=151549 RepID=A0A4C1TPZ1_EUMVA|nr:hypothetical protein EVAR_94361_1 [Eumeta japonica]
MHAAAVSGKGRMAMSKVPGFLSRLNPVSIQNSILTSSSNLFNINLKIKLIALWSAMVMAVKNGFSTEAFPDTYLSAIAARRTPHASGPCARTAIFRTEKRALGSYQATAQVNPSILFFIYEVVIWSLISPLWFSEDLELPKIVVTKLITMFGAGKLVCSTKIEGSKKF